MQNVNNKSINIGGKTLGRNPAVKVEGKLFTGVPTSAVVRAARKTEKFALKTVRLRSPVDTGTMQRSWYSNLDNNKSGVQISIANDVFYTKFQEFGTRKLRPKLMATKTLPAAQQYFKETLAEELNTELGGTLETIERGVTNAITRILGLLGN